MTSGNKNHPKAGSQIKVEPIKNLKDIKAIKTLLKDSPRNSTLFILGINTNLSPSELIHLKYTDVKDLGDNGIIKIEDENGKVKEVTLNRSCILSIKSLIEGNEYEEDDFLFKSQRGKLIVPSVHRLIDKWCTAVNLKENYGSHTLRKTWGYHQHHTFGAEIKDLMGYFNHSSKKQTMDYLCIDEKKAQDLFLNEL
ncbi:MAG: tyrosine-type recombinase/integrase [Desulfobacterales bacterium]|nr:tyrosine-type recombinase/integrase [Desulfobacterales bacterium]MCP4162881.1 tyrosine-type recombinase/integrase [Deltaproteobacteria bacterium]